MAGFGDQGRIPGQIINPPAGSVRFVCQLKRSAACDRRRKAKCPAVSLVNQLAEGAFHGNKIPQLCRIGDVCSCQSYGAAVCGSQRLAAVQCGNVESIFRTGQFPAVNGFVSVIPPQHYAAVLLQMIFCAVFAIVEDFERVCFIIVAALSGIRGNKHIVVIVRNRGRIPGGIQKILRENLVKESIGFRIIF